MASIIIFGFLDTALLAHFYLKHDSQHNVVAFTVHQENLPQEDTLEGLPIVPFEKLPQLYSPSKYYLFAPMTHRKMNRVREAVYKEGKEMGYDFISYVSSKATLFPNTEIGDNCFILEDNTIQPFTKIGNNVVLWSGNHIGHHSEIQDHVFFTSQVVLSGHCVVEPYCFLGVNSTIRDFTRISEGSYIAMGATITQDTEPWSVYQGNPAKKRKVSSEYIDL